MKNIHVLPTDKPSRLYLDKNEKLQYIPVVQHNYNSCVNIYITSDEEIKREDCILLPNNEIIVLPTGLSQVPLNNFIRGYSLSDCKKIILTTDQDLIKDGVQEIDNEFLEWFVKNPSCEEVEIMKLQKKYVGVDKYEIIIPEEPKQGTMSEAIKEVIKNQLNQIEEHKQETLEEAAKKYSENWEEITGLDYENVVPSEVNKLDFINGAKWQQERSYSEEEIYNLIQAGYSFCEKGKNREDVKKWFEQFKKK